MYNLKKLVEDHIDEIEQDMFAPMFIDYAENYADTVASKDDAEFKELYNLLLSVGCSKTSIEFSRRGCLKVELRHVINREAQMTNKNQDFVYSYLLWLLPSRFGYQPHKVYDAISSLEGDPQIDSSVTFFPDNHFIRIEKFKT